MKRITVKCGTETRRFCFEKPPYPKVGDILTVKGNGVKSEGWTVSNIQNYEGPVYHVTFPQMKEQMRPEPKRKRKA